LRDLILGACDVQPSIKTGRPNPAFAVDSLDLNFVIFDLPIEVNPFYCTVMHLRMNNDMMINEKTQLNALTGITFGAFFS